MSWTWLLLFAPACFALNVAPGPSNVLAFATSAEVGARIAILGGAGRLSHRIGGDARPLAERVNRWNG